MSVALEEWHGASARALDEIETLQRQVEASRGTALTEQINQMYAALILAHFQRYCRVVHTEAADVVAASMPDSSLAAVLKSLLVRDRSLDRGNPTPGALGADFGRFGFEFWPAVEANDRRNRISREELGRRCEWRNGIAHGDIARKRAAGRLVPPDLELDTCTGWRQSLGGLAVSIDMVIARRCQTLGSANVW